MSEGMFEVILRELQALRGSVDAGAVRQEAMRADITAMRVDIAALTSGQEAMRADVATLRADVATVRADMDALRSAHLQWRDEVSATFASLRGDMMDRMDRLQDSITQLQDEIGVNFHRADRAVKQVGQFRSELSSVMGAYRDELDSLNSLVTALEKRVLTLSSEFLTYRLRRDTGEASPGH